MVVYAATIVPLLRRIHASHAAFLGFTAWGLGAVVIALPVLLT
jgi:hypothetical protein